MASEHVRLSHAESMYAQKNVLQGVIDLLNATKKHRAYKTLRKEELLYKIQLKQALQDAKTSLELLDKLLPKTSFVQHSSPSPVTYHEERKKLSLEQEIHLIKHKLQTLQ